MLAAKCTTCSAPDPILHTQSRKSRNSIDSSRNRGKNISSISQRDSQFRNHVQRKQGIGLGGIL
jgi:hypothetical protein